MASARPQVSVFSIEGKKSTSVNTVALPDVFLAPIRSDVVKFVHSNMAKNRRQAYGVNVHAGEQHSAESWGTGRAVARIPRVAGGGTHAAGSGAFGNMCRGGRMFSPTKIWRRWHRKINVTQKRVALTSALAASALPALVMARGHKVDKISEVPLVVKDDFQSIKKTKDAIVALKKLHAFGDVKRVKRSHQVRTGKGKMRNRRYISRRGPLVIFKEDNGLTKAFRNLPGVETVQVSRLNLLQLAPGGHLGRFIIWTESAFASLDALYGSYSTKSEKKGFNLPVSQLKNSNIGRIINSDEVQRVLRPKQKTARFHLKKNPLTNLFALAKLNPYALTERRVKVKTDLANKKRKETISQLRAEGKPVPEEYKKKTATLRKAKTDKKPVGQKFYSFMTQ